jgi:hypothetical protein
VNTIVEYLPVDSERPFKISPEVAAFVRKGIGLPSYTEIKSSDVLEDDFGVTGDNADEFMAAF